VVLPRQPKPLLRDGMYVGIQNCKVGIQRESNESRLKFPVILNEVEGFPLIQKNWHLTSPV